MRSLSNAASEWLSLVPEVSSKCILTRHSFAVTRCFQKLSKLKRTAENIKDPLYRFYEREVRLLITIPAFVQMSLLNLQVNIGVQLLQDVRSGLSAVVDCCEARRKLTNELRSLISDLTKGSLIMNVPVVLLTEFLFERNHSTILASLYRPPWLDFHPVDRRLQRTH